MFTSTSSLAGGQATSKRGQSVLYQIRKGYFNHIRYLLEHNLCDPNEISQSNYNPCMPPSKSIFLPKLNANRSRSCMGQLQSNEIPSLKATPLNGLTPLILCTFIEDSQWAYSIAQNLIEKGGIVGRKDQNGLNAVMYACLNQKENLLNLYLSAHGDYHLDATDNLGNTVVHMASLSPHESMCHILRAMCLKLNVSIKKMRNKFGHTSEDLCKLKGHAGCEQQHELKKKVFQPKPNNNNKNEFQVTFYEPQQKQEVAHRSDNVDATSSVLEFYKNIYSFKEKPIKTNLSFDLHDHSNYAFESGPTPQTTTTKMTKKQQQLQARRDLLNTSSLNHNLINKMFDDLEMQASDSYRRGLAYQNMRRVSIQNHRKSITVQPPISTTMRVVSRFNQSQASMSLSRASVIQKQSLLEEIM